MYRCCTAVIRKHERCDAGNNVDAILFRTAATIEMGTGHGFTEEHLSCFILWFIDVREKDV
jgi:hypothetical protein